WQKKLTRQLQNELLESPPPPTVAPLTFYRNLLEIFPRVRGIPYIHELLYRTLLPQGDPFGNGFLQQALDACKGSRIPARVFPRNFQGPGLEQILLHHLIDQSDLQRLPRRIHLPGKKHLLGFFRANAINQNSRASGKYRRAEPDLVERDFRFPIDHEPVVAGDRHHAASGNRVAVQCGYHRLRETEQISVKICECVKVSFELAFRIAQEFGNIEPKRKKPAGTRQDHRPNALIGFQAPKNIVQLRNYGPVESIHFPSLNTDCRD